MDNARQTRRPWRSWGVIALVLIGLALVQACGKSGSSTGPSTTSSFQLKLRRAGGAELPGGCTGGTFTVFGFGNKVLATGNFGPDGKISLSLPVDQTVTMQVTVFCPDGQHTGSTTLNVVPGGVTGTIVINVSKVLGLSCSPSTVAPNQESTCTCNASAPGTPSITWTGPVNPKTGKTVKFKESNPGTYSVSCTVNGVDTQSTTVTVRSPEVLPPPLPPTPETGTIEIFNEFNLQQRRKGLAQHSECSFCEIHTRVIGVPGTTRQIEKEHSTKVSVPPGTHSVEGSCDPSFDGTFAGNPPSVTVAAGQEVDVHFAGHCED